MEPQSPATSSGAPSHLLHSRFGQDGLLLTPSHPLPILLGLGDLSELHLSRKPSLLTPGPGPPTCRPADLPELCWIPPCTLPSQECQPPRGRAFPVSWVPIKAVLTDPFPLWSNWNFLCFDRTKFLGASL